jgi:hypothetical protein
MRPMLVLLALLFLEGWGGLTAHAQETPVPQCQMPVGPVIAYMEGRDYYAGHTVLTDKQRELPGSVINMSPPVTDIDWTLIVLLDRKDGAGYIIAGMDDKVCSSLMLEANKYQALKRSVFGSPA